LASAITFALAGGQSEHPWLWNSSTTVKRLWSAAEAGTAPREIAAKNIGAATLVTLILVFVIPTLPSAVQ
jgi:hypothetical protein